MKIVLFLLEILIPTCLVIFFDIKLFSKDKNKINYIKIIVKDTFLINLLTLSTLSLVFNQNNLMMPLKQETFFFVLLILANVIYSVLYIGFKYLFNHYIETNEVSLKNKVNVRILYGLSIVLFFVGILAFLMTIWGKNTFDDAMPDEILITLLSPTGGTDPVIMLGFIEKALIPSITFTYLFALLFYKRVTTKWVNKNKVIFSISEHASRITTIVMACATLVSGIFYGAYKFQLKTLIISYTESSPYIEENFVNPKDVKLTFPKKKRNLIHIYLESIENSYFGKEDGGNMNENLMPNLKELSKEGYSFSHLGKGEGFGGPLKTYGATWSVASMVNQFFGFPMKVPAKNNAYGKKGNFFPGAVGIGDIFKKLGYEQTMMIGAEASFGGLNFMFEDHGDFKIMDHKYALEHDMLPSKDYNVNWGYEDEKLYTFAQNELTRLASSGKPFHFLMENADTHYPGFHFEGDTPIFGSSKAKDYAQTIRFSDAHVVPFIRWIMAQPFYKDTTIVIIGDHLSMDKTFFMTHEFKNYKRSTYNLILNPANTEDLNNEQRFYNRKWASYDMMPTLLAAMGVKIEGNRLGLGANLFSDEKTLFEKDGYDYVNDRFIRKSPYYNDNFVFGKFNYTGDNLIVSK